MSNSAKTELLAASPIRIIDIEDLVADHIDLLRVIYFAMLSDPDDDDAFETLANVMNSALKAH